MATTVDELLVRIRADTKGLEAALGRVKTKTNSTFKPSIMDRFKRSLGGIRGMALAAAAALASIAVVKVARVGAEFESLKLSLQQVYGSAQQGEEAFRQIQTFAQESPFQIKDLTKAFIQLKTAGIEPTKDLLNTFADASSVAVDSLGAFQAMVRITQRSAGGGLGLEELEQISDRGIPVYEILAAKIGVTRDKISEMGKTAEGSRKIMNALNEGMKEQFGGATALKMTTLNQKLSNMSDAFDTLADVIYSDAGLGGAMKFLVDQAKDFADYIAEAVQMAATGMSREFVQATTLEDKLAIAIRDRTANENTESATRKGAMAFNRNKASRDAELAAVIANLRQQIKERDRLAEQGALELKRAKLAKKEAIARADEEERIVTAREKALENLASILSGVKTPAEIIRQKMADINAEIALLGTGESGKFTVEELKEALKRLGVELKDIEEKSSDLADTLQDKLLDAVVDNVNAFTTDFVMALLNGQSALESFKNFSKQIVSQIIATFMQMLVINKIVDTIGMALAEMSGGSYSRTSSGPQIVNKASGGAMGRGRPYIVGERGPELFIPNTSGTLRNGNDTRSMGGGGIVINQSINLSTGVAATVRSEVSKMMPTISEVTKASVLEAASRGGKFQKGLMGA